MSQNLAMEFWKKTETSDLWLAKKEGTKGFDVCILPNESLASSLPLK
jgi:hypothetical protein